MDVVYLVRDGRNFELRYSLRSLRNLPHTTVWFVGHVPRYVDGVRHIPGNRHRQPWQNVFDNLRLACEHVPAERFVVMNDDFYILEPVAELPSWHRGPLVEHVAIAKSWWRQSLQSTLDFLTGEGVADPLSYELHVPVVMERDRLAAVLDRAAAADLPMTPQWRTLYGNLWKVPSEPAPDVKVRHNRQEWTPGTFLSTEDYTFRTVRAFLADLFPDPSPYEVAP